PSQFAAQTAFAEVHHALLWLRNERRIRGLSDSFQSLLGRLRTSSKPMDAIVGWVPESNFPKSWWRQLQKHRRAGKSYTGKSRELRFRGDKKHQAKGAGYRHLTLANRLLALRRPKAAVIEYRRAFRVGVKGDPLVWARMARALLVLDRPEQAERYLDGVQSVDHAPIWVVRGQIALAQNAPLRAIKYARRAIYLNPVEPRVHQLLAASWRLLGDSNRADAALAAARLLQSID
ncbi:MAG: hypothetical protein CMH53_08425, partial [Myxococcales bacterium]|nr:hypothetical protein [Myxococcales bacterium]